MESEIDTTEIEREFNFSQTPEEEEENQPEEQLHCIACHKNFQSVKQFCDFHYYYYLLLLLFIIINIVIITITVTNMSGSVDSSVIATKLRNVD